jgi:type I restriction enzyme S subunit
MFAQKILANELIDILAAPSYSPELLSYVNKISDAVILKDFLIKKPKLGVTGAIAKDYVHRETPEAVPYISTKQVSGLYAYIEDAKFISMSADIEWEKCRVNDGDIVINKSGNVGAAAIVKANPYKYVNSVSDIISIEVDEFLIDKEYLEVVPLV